MRRRLAALAACLVLVLPASAVAGGWKVVKKKSVSGQFAVTALDATISSPKAIAVDLIGGGGDVVWACSKGFSVSSNTKMFGSGLHVLPNVAGKGSCDITVSIDGQGKLTAEILTK